MIPYDDLVAALSAWRARQGLPVSTMGGGGSSAAPTSGTGPHAQHGSGPYGGSGPMRSKPASVPPPLDDAMAVDDAEMIEEQYDDYGQGEQTAVGETPERPTDPSDLRGGRNRW